MDLLTVEGTVASAVNLDNGVPDFFENGENGVYYHGLKLGPLLFQDDVARLSTDLSSAQGGNERMHTRPWQPFQIVALPKRYSVGTNPSKVFFCDSFGEIETCVHQGL